MAKTIVLPIEINLDDNNAPGKVRSLNKELHDLGGKSSASAVTGLGSLKMILGGLGVGYVVTQIGQMATALARLGVDGAIHAIKVADSFELMEKRLAAVRGSSQQAAQDFEWIQKQAQKTPATIDEVTRAFIKLTAYGLEPTDGTFQALTDTGFALGGSMEHVEGIILAVGQAWTKGKLQGEEALQMLERGVPVWDMLSKALGMTNAEVQDLATKGLLGREAIDALIAALKVEYLGAAADAMDTISGKTSNLSDQAMKAAAHIGDMASDEVKRALDGVAQVFTDLDNAGAVDALGRGLETIAGTLADIVEEPAIVVTFALLAEYIERMSAGLSRAVQASGSGQGILGMLAGMSSGMSGGGSGRVADPLLEIEEQIARMLDERQKAEEKIRLEQEAQEKALAAQAALQAKIAAKEVERLKTSEFLTVGESRHLAYSTTYIANLKDEAGHLRTIYDESTDYLSQGVQTYLQGARVATTTVYGELSLGAEGVAAAFETAVKAGIDNTMTNFEELQVQLSALFTLGLGDAVFLAMTGRFDEIDDAFASMVDRMAQTTADNLVGSLLEGDMAGARESALTGLGLAGVSYGVQEGGSAGIIAGMLGGALTGFQMAGAAGGLGAGWGALIGAVVGGAMAYFGGQSESPETDFSIGAPQGTAAGSLRTRGHQGVSAAENFAFVREQEAAYSQAEGQYRNLLAALGMDYGALIDLPAFDTNGYTSASIAEIREYFQNEWLPEAMRQAFWEPLSEGLRGIGLDQTAVDALDRELSKLPGANQFDQLSMFITNVSALVDTAASMDWNAILDDVGASSMDQFLSGFTAMRGDIGQAMAGLDSMSLLDQAELAGSINDMMLRARQAEIQMLRQIDAAQNSINRSIGQQIEGLELGGMSEQGQLSYVNRQIQTILGNLRAGEYTSPEALQQAMGDLQRYVGMYQQTAGQNLYNESPFGGGSIADWLVSVLEEGRGLSDQAFEGMRDAVKEQNDALIAEMERLIEAITTFNDNFNEGGSGGGTRGDGTDPSNPWNQGLSVFVNNYITGQVTSIQTAVAAEPTTAIS